MTRGKQKLEAQKKNAEKNQKSKGSQFEARSVGLKVVCPVCKAQLANHNQLVDHYSSKHPKEKPPATLNSTNPFVPKTLGCDALKICN